MRPKLPKESPLAEPLMIRGRPPRSTAAALLESQGLPVSDITDEHLEHFFFVGSDGSPTGLVGLELYGTDALLRSLVVGENARGNGLGSTLVEHAEQYAASQGVRSIYLLTTTAESFSSAWDMSGSIALRHRLRSKKRVSSSSLCPASSAFMMKTL